MSADFDGSNENVIEGQEGLFFSKSIVNPNPFLLILQVKADIDGENILVAQCRTAVQTEKGTAGFYSLRQGGPNDGFVDANEKIDIYFHYYKERKLDSTEITLQTTEITMYDITDAGNNIFDSLMTSQSLAYNIPYNNLTIKEGALETGKNYILTIPQTLNSDPTKYVYSIILISTVDRSDKMTIVDQGSGSSPTVPATFVYSVNQQNLVGDEQLDIYCDRGIYRDGVFHV